jgi:plasmid stabilization system protein ParE
VRIRYSLQALADLEAIFEYFDTHAPATAPALKSAIELAINRLEAFPYLAAATDEPAVRVLALARYRYRIYYTVDAKNRVITVLHVRHMSRRPLRPGRS